MSKTALVVIDMQRAMFETPGEVPHDGDRVLAAVLALLGASRQSATPVVFVQHTASSPGHPLHREAKGWPLHPALAPRAGESVVEKTTFDAFHQTSLQHTLDSLGAKRLIMCGMQTEFCVDTSCRRAFSLGYDVLLVADAHTTFETEIIPAQTIVAHHNRTLGGRFCKTLKSAEAIALMPA